MRNNNLVVLVVAIILGGIAAVLARNWLANRARLTQGDVGTIVVAASPIAFGTELTKENTKVIPWSTASLPEGAFATKDDLLQGGRRMALALIARNEPILGGKISAPNQPATLSTVLTPGKRAVTVRVDDVRGVAGFIEPGDLVDVVLIRTEADSRSNQSYSDIILQAAKVLAIDQITGERTDKPTIAKAVTLEVTPEDAQKILLATNIGRLSLILRQPVEAHADHVQRITAQTLGDPPPPPRLTLPPHPPVELVKPPPAAPVVAKPAPKPPQLETQRITIWRDLKPQIYVSPVYSAHKQTSGDYSADKQTSGDYAADKQGGDLN
jgi:pilus assembly protein CpaB